eukprot:TRINITY_DN2530_c0_g1_i1.p1 TRINITY_DN2530_c0_g1~~TRINITY_DN2530_c0_g1_i1.p1  ORF type:complete len:304 (+),score=76.74 TRINITY_DN2530_c0_g1_i1:109-1020(+)
MNLQLLALFLFFATCLAAPLPFSWVLGQTPIQGNEILFPYASSWPDNNNRSILQAQARWNPNVGFQPVLFLIPNDHPELTDKLLVRVIPDYEPTDLTYLELPTPNPSTDVIGTGEIKFFLDGVLAWSTSFPYDFTSSLHPLKVKSLVYTFSSSGGFPPPGCPPLSTIYNVTWDSSQDYATFTEDAQNCNITTRQPIRIQQTKKVDWVSIANSLPWIAPDFAASAAKFQSFTYKMYSGVCDGPIKRSSVKFGFGGSSSPLLSEVESFGGCGQEVQLAEVVPHIPWFAFHEAMDSLFQKIFPFRR